MTRLLKKKWERFFAEEAAKRLGRNWKLGPDQERPDFLVTDEAYQFGLEVCEVFNGPLNQSGATMKVLESKAQQAINEVRRDFEKVCDVTLIVKFVGNMSADNIAAVVPALLAKDLSTKPIGFQFVIDQGTGLRIHVTKAFRADWYSVNHRVGWVNRDPFRQIDEAIEKKSKGLPEYRAHAGTDIRLLLVANHIYNSGKISFDTSANFDLRGFRSVYFFSYPEKVEVLGCIRA